MVKYDENGQFADIVCDKCGKGSPPTADLIINHGLTGMGWKCSGGSHVCSECDGRYDEIVEAVGEQEADRLIICAFGSIDATYEHLVAVGSITPDEECAA